MAFRKNNNTTNSNFNQITINLVSPEEVLERSSGEVLKPETINYRTYKPERDGLFCERIFGPVKDYECHCGKYKRIRYRGIVCDRCGVEVTEKKVRRERSGHISLVVPVVHIWYFKSLPNKIGYLLGLPAKKLDSIIYYEKYVVIQPGVKEKDGVKYLDFISEEEYIEILETLPPNNNQLEDSDPNKFIAKMGAEALYDLLQNLDIDALALDLKEKSQNETSQQRKNDALKRLQVISAFKASQDVNKPERMIIKILPVIPPELRPLVPLDGGRFATSDLNDLYRRVIIRNNRLKKLMEIKAPEVILRNEKRMLQEAVDSLLDNSRKSSAVKSDSNRALKSLSDSLKGKQGRFRQNLLGKRVDYSARSVIVVGPELKMHECGIPKQMAAELYKPFVIRKLIERGIVKTVKSAKKIIDRREPVVWDILENVLKGHPILLNRAPTLHRLGIQAFQPKLIEGKAIQLHPLSCTAFNADFDGDQMAVHLPLGNAAILEAQFLMLASHNILNPANGAPITVPSQDMVLGLYYITKARKSTPELKIKGEGLTFYSAQEAIIAYNEGQADMHAVVNLRLDGKIFETTVGRIIFNQYVPKEVGYINTLLTKKSLRKIIGDVLTICGTSKTANFLDDIKSLGYKTAFQGGLSFNLDDVIIPKEKESMVNEGYAQVANVMNNFNLGVIAGNERYNQIIDIWTHTNEQLTQIVMNQLSQDNQGFNSVYMMLDSGARGSREQIRQLAGMRGLMAKPQKSGTTGGAIIENPILANFKEGLSVLEYFISTHGARKGLADTALKTADAGYLTRRLVDVAQDVVVSEDDCGTLRGLKATAITKKDDVVESLYERILGRTSLYDVTHPTTNEIIVKAGDEITETVATQIEEAGIDEVYIRSALTCETRYGICAKCYGRSLSSRKIAQRGESVGVIAAQSIGEPGTQLTLRTFHVGGVAGGSATENSIKTKYAGIAQFEELKTVETTDDEKQKIVTSRMTELTVYDKNNDTKLTSYSIPYGAKIFVEEGQELEKGDLICEWDPYNAVIVTEFSGTISFKDLVESVTFKIEKDEQTNFIEKVIIETKDKNKNPEIHITTPDGEVLASYNLPAGAHISKNNGDTIKVGEIIAKIPRNAGKAGDITGGLPRVTELFEARNPSNPAAVAEIDGIVEFGRVKRGKREVIIRAKSGKEKKYLISLAKQILVQPGDFVKAGFSLSDGAVTPADILAIKGPTAVQEYIVNEVQEVYRLQGVKINDKHFEVIVRQMMKKVFIQDPGDTRYREKQVVNRWDFREENERIYGHYYIVEGGDSKLYSKGEIISPAKFHEENDMLKRKGLVPMTYRQTIAATSEPVLQGITKAALQTKSFISAASFQETTKVLNQSAIESKTDHLRGLKENVIVGHKIPAGTGMREYSNIIVGLKEEYESMVEEDNK